MAANLPPMPPDTPAPVTFPPAGAQAPGLEPLPWEQEGTPFLEALFETARLIVVEPEQAFARMSLTTSLTRPILYAIIFGWLGVIVQQVYQLLLGTPWLRFLPGLSRFETLAGSAFWTGTATVMMMVLAPLFIILWLFIWAGLVHLFLMLYGGTTSGFEATVRVVAYGSTVQLLQVVPMVGGLIAGIWGIVLQVIGIAIVHRTTQGKAAAAVLSPIALCCVCAVAMVVAFGAAILAAVAAAAGSR